MITVFLFHSACKRWVDSHIKRSVKVDCFTRILSKKTVKGKVKLFHDGIIYDMN